MARRPPTAAGERALTGRGDPATSLSIKALEVHRRLCELYECPIDYFHALDPLSELVSSLLSHRTRNRDSGSAFKALRARFPSWQHVIDAPTAEVREAIAAVTWPELKAPRIQQVLRRVLERRGGLSLDFLATLSPADAKAWLRELPGVGPKTAAAVLSFSTLRMAALPVDSHHHRVAERVGLLPKGTSLERAHELLAAQLPGDWSPQQVYDNHEVLMLHGQRCCFYASPACQRCPLLDLCPTGRQRLASPLAVEPTRGKDAWASEPEGEPDLFSHLGRTTNPPDGANSS
jgi:endonuclease-3